MGRIQKPDGLYFYDDTVIYQQITHVIPDDLTFVFDLNRVLLEDFQILAGQLMGQSIFVNFFQKACANSVPNGKSGPYYFLGNLVTFFRLNSRVHDLGFISL